MKEWKGIMRITNRVKKVALGAGFAIKAISNINAARVLLKWRAEDKALTVMSLVIFRPLCGRKP